MTQKRMIKIAAAALAVAGGLMVMDSGEGKGLDLAIMIKLAGFALVGAAAWLGKRAGKAGKEGER